MDITYGAGRAGLALDLRANRLRVISPERDELCELGATHYYRSRSGLSGAVRVPARPWLQPLTTFRDLWHELPDATGISRPVVAVTRGDVDWQIPVITDITDCQERLSIAVASPSDPARWRAQDTETLLGAIHYLIFGRWHRREVSVASIGAPDYAARRLAWRVARKIVSRYSASYLAHVLAGLADRPDESWEWGVVPDPDAPGQQYLTIDRCGIVTGGILDTTALRWALVESDERPPWLAPHDVIGSPVGAVLIGTIDGDAYRFDPEAGTSHRLVGARIDWHRGTVSVPDSQREA